MAMRRDALLAASRAIVALRTLADGAPERLHASVGRILVSPNSSNVVPDQVELTAEIRSPDDSFLIEMEEATGKALQDAAMSAGVTLDILSRSLRLARSLPVEFVDFLDGCCQALNIPAMRLETVAGHDALSLVGLAQQPSFLFRAWVEFPTTRPKQRKTRTWMPEQASCWKLPFGFAAEQI